VSPAEGFIDVNARLVWSRYKLHRARLIAALMGSAAGLVIAVLAVDVFETVLGWGSVAVFFPWAFYEIYWLMKPDTALIELLPQGIIFRTTTEDFIVPWNEIHGIDSIDVHTSFRGRSITYHNVTVILVTQHFYDRVIHVDSFIMRGPGWEANFIPKGDRMQLALHHEVIPASAEEIRRQVEARLRVFGKVSAATTPAPTPSR
jgi:hypothetical protein